MDGASIYTLLTERSKGGVNFFDSSTYVVGLYLADPSRTHLERFVKSALIASIQKAQNLQSVVKMGTRSPATSSSRIDIGLERLFHYADAVTESVAGQKADPQMKEVFSDIVEEETLRIQNLLHAIKSTGVDRLESMPDRIQKCRALGELAAKRFLDSTEDEGADILNEACLHLKEVLEQPVGQRDPFTWLLFGWVNLQRGQRDHAQHSFLQACLASGADRDPLYFEATRLLASAQVENGAPEIAYQTLSKSFGVQPDQSLLFDRVRVCAKTDREAEVKEIIPILAKKWPLSILGAFGDPDLVRTIASWRTEAEAVASEWVEETCAALRTWKGAGEQVTSILNSLDPDLELPSPILAKISGHEDASAELDLFRASWLKSEADRGIREVMDAGKVVLTQRARGLEAEAITAQNRIENLKGWRDQAIAEQIAKKSEAEGAERVRLGLDVGDDRAQAGCLMSSGVGCAGYAAYFVTCFVSTSVMMAAGPNTGIGKVVLIALALPIAFGILFLIADGTRRTVAQKELYRHMNELGGEFDDAVEEINRIYREKLPELTEDLKELRSRKEQTENTIRKLQSRPTVTQDAA